MTSFLMQLALIVNLFGGSGSPAADSPLRIGAPADSSSATDYAPSLSSWNLSPQTAKRARFWSNMGYGQISKQYGPDSELIDAGGVAPLPTSLAVLAASLGQPLPDGVDGTVQGAGARISGTMSVVNVHVGAAYDVVRRPSYAVTLGADVGFSQQYFQADKLTFDIDDATVTIPGTPVDGQPLADFAAANGLQIPASVASDRTIQSGFSAQSLTVFGELERKVFSARAGYQLDLGPSPDLDVNRRENTDRQDAVLLGVSAHHNAGSLTFFGGTDAYLTLNGRNGDFEFDAGDVYGVNAGVGYHLGIAEVGAAVTFRYKTEGTSVIVTNGQTYSSAVLSGHHLGIAPYVSVSPAGGSFSAYLKGGVQDEYRDYTLSITGENDFAPTAGATFGFVYGL